MLIVCSYHLTAQSNFQLGLLPVVNVNKKLQKDFKLNFKTETRQIILHEDIFELKHGLLDFSLVLAKKIGLSSSLAGGYFLRFRDDRLIQRSIQQFSITQSKNFYRVSHRFTSDQTFSENEETSFRLRYRIAGQFALNGQSVNPREFYIKLNNEYLNEWQSNDHELEIRIGVFLGYEINDNNKLEFGLENRLDSFTTELRNRAWINTAWYVAI